MEEERYIICVDDEKIMLDSLSLQLMRHFGNQYYYEFAESAEEALDIIEDLLLDEKSTIFAIISDWLMPGMKGDELLDLVNEKMENVKTILLTGHIEKKFIQKIDSEANNKIQYIFKPWEENHLIRLITA